jgi:hypothetical protein
MTNVFRTNVFRTKVIEPDFFSALCIRSKLLLRDRHGGVGDQHQPGQFHKTFYGHDLSIYVLSWSICKNRLEKLVRDKCLKLIIKISRLHPLKVLYYWAPGQFHKNFMAVIHNLRTKLECL